MSSSLQKRIGVWFLVLSFGIGGMVALGGITRLTGAGLSIVTWDILKGIFPPFSAQEWESVFAAYKTSPEFQKINLYMSLGDFKKIYWLEYSHRLMGRILFLVLCIPSFFLVVSSQVSKRTKNVLIIGLLLYMAQGGVGWYMVKSGLIEDPFVSPFRLMIHLIMALGLFSLFLWEAFRLLIINKYILEISSIKRRQGFLVALIGIGVTIVLGALVAGFKAGLLYPTFPFMGNVLIPSEIWDLVPWYRNFLENPTALYAFHRMVAFGSLLFLWGWIFWAAPKHTASYWRIMIFPLILSGMQLILGALTALSHVSPLWASLHQINAFCLWGTLLVCFYILSFRAKTPGSSFPSSHSKNAPPAVET